MTGYGQTIRWLLEDPPPDELLAVERKLGLYAEEIRPRGAKRIEVKLAPDRQITSVKLFPPGAEELAPESLGAALETLAKNLPMPPPWEPKPPGTTPDPPPDRVEPPGIETL